ncbi:hypothetical protein DY000_02004123 [Brassica cretica]|uniref:Uncharacterized protein n=1 Tax=Brassica cretica TaxID=69181 RepID=A0ABQ7C8S8_BRACR|nr:hypothetical protein DY000_02004123 [Brassica cretica]
MVHNRQSGRRRATRKNRLLADHRFQVNPMSSLTSQDLSRIRESYHIPASVMLRVPSENERANSPCPNEIAVYEAYFALDLRETIPSLISEVAKFFDISPSQFTSSAWRMLTAIQVFGELHSQKLGVKEVLYAHYFRSHDIDASRYIIPKRPSGDPLVYDLQPNEKRTASYEKNWERKYLFMNVGHNPPFPTAWCLRDTSTKRCEEGKRGAFKVFKHPRERRSAKGANMSRFDGLEGDAALERYKASSSISRELSAGDCRETLPDIPLKRKSSRNEAVGVPSSKKAATGKELVFSPSASGAVVAAPPPPHVELIKAASLCHFAETKLRTAQNEKKEDLEVISDLLMKLDSAKKREEKLSNEVLARNQDTEILKSEKDSLTKRAAELEQEKQLLKGEAELAGYSAVIVNTWKLIKEYKMGNADKWNAVAAEKNYRNVLEEEALRKGEVPPVFPDTFTDFDQQDPH